MVRVGTVLTARAVTRGWSFATHATSTILGVTTWAIAWGRAFGAPTSAAFFAIAARAIVVRTTFWAETAVTFLTVVRGPIHFVPITTARTIEVMMARRAIKTSVG
jgi:hypothetical protein